MSELITTLRQHLEAAMRCKDKAVLNVVRGLLTDLKNTEIQKKRPLTKSEEIEVLSRQVKQRQQSIDAFTEAGYTEKAAAEQWEQDWIKCWLPKQLSHDDVVQIAAAKIVQFNATSPSDFGKVMGAVMKEIKGQFDGKEANQIVKTLLN